MTAIQRIVISGGPGTGKTSLIWALEEAGFRCIHEISREIIREELAAKTNVLPWADLQAFSEKVYAGRKEQFGQSQNGLNFYDRSVIDTIAYMHKDGMVIPAAWEQEIKSLRYSDPVFITPPWREIFGNDHERRESWQQLVDVHNSLVAAYKEAGYTIVEIPKVSIEERMQFVLSRVK